MPLRHCRWRVSFTYAETSAYKCSQLPHLYERSVHELCPCCMMHNYRRGPSIYPALRRLSCLTARPVHTSTDGKVNAVSKTTSDDTTRRNFRFESDGTSKLKAQLYDGMNMFQIYLWIETQRVQQSKSPSTTVIQSKRDWMLVYSKSSKKDWRKSDGTKRNQMK